MQARSFTARLAVLGVVFVASCADPTRVIDDEGAFCIQSGTEGQLSVQVHFPTCLSSSCNRVDVSECSITVAGTTVHIDSHAEIADISASVDGCSADCRMVTATCSTDAPPAGTYRVVHGNADAEVTLPLRQSVCTKDDAFAGAHQ